MRHPVGILTCLLVIALLAPGTAPAAAATRVTVAAPSSVVTGTTILIRGKVPTASRRSRVAGLYEKRGSSWVRVLKRATSRTGAFRFQVGSGSRLVTRTFQVRAPRVRGAAGTSTRVVRIAVLARGYAPTTRPPAPLPVAEPYDAPAVLPASEPRPLGSATDWTWVLNEQSRWNPCAVITWAYNPSGSRYAAALADLQAAVAQLSARSGLRFRYVGTTSALGGLGRANPPGIDVVTGWTDAAHESAFRDGMSGLGGAAGYGSVHGTGIVLSSGFLLLNNGKSMAAGFASSGNPTWGQLMTHELMHALGLGHAAGSGQVMYPTAWSGNHRFGAGDLAGLAQIGSARGCWS
ncbi:hypothetical protein [Marmoricola sp. RAF53]|uniref:hypothetical protein n=1 Tax=Marmoricola sp. RAF53 TaxID=3233059 RepID=UPI003F9610C9